MDARVGTVSGVKAGIEAGTVGAATGIDSSGVDADLVFAVWSASLTPPHPNTPTTKAATTLLRARDTCGYLAGAISFI
jgi:hypothetical protein